MITTAIKKDTLRGLDTPRPITSEAQNHRYTALLLEMERRDDLTKAEKLYMEVVTLLVEAYENEHYPIADASPIEVLTELMAANDLRQKDLVPEFGSESIVSEVLSGKKPLNLHHIERLSRRFSLSPAVFFSEVKR
jgi:HTH-type transcriptional regulator/antitoxin HigA